MISVRLLCLCGHDRQAHRHHSSSTHCSHTEFTEDATTVASRCGCRRWRWHDVQIHVRFGR